MEVVWDVCLDGCGDECWVEKQLEFSIWGESHVYLWFERGVGLERSSGFKEAQREREWREALNQRCPRAPPVGGGFAVLYKLSVRSSATSA